MQRHAFFERVKKAQADLKIGHQGGWFRGVKHGEYECIPSYHRYYTLKRRESNLMARFVRQGARYLQPNSSKWERLAFMQHYGVPTKLLDWSLDITSAIYFALVYNVGLDEKLEEPHVWVLNPFRLNEIACGRRLIFDNMDEIPLYEPSTKDGTKWPYQTPIAIALNWFDSRIEHQQGVFTYHGTREGPIDQVAGDWVRRVVIRPDEISDLVQHLRDAGVSHHRIFQSPDALGKDIKEKSTGDSILWARMTKNDST